MSFGGGGFGGLQQQQQQQQTPQMGGGPGLGGGGGFGQPSPPNIAGQQQQQNQPQNQTAPQTNPNNDMLVQSSPQDGITSLKWSPTGNFLVATGWDNKVLCYDVQPNGQALPKAAMEAHEAPVMASVWSPDGSAVFSGGCDNQAKKWDLGSNQTTQVAQHDGPIRHMAWIQQHNILCTGSWDKTLKYWDARQPNPVSVAQLPERCYALDVKQNLLVCGTAERHILVYNMQNPTQPYKQLYSPLKYQTRCIAAFPDQSGDLVGSIEGRVAVQHVEDNMKSANFTFKCHREQNDIYAVNSISFHPTFGTFVTAGADGNYNFWDKDSKQRLKAMQKVSCPISCGDFNRDGTIYAYAASYEWSKGGDNPMANQPNNIYLHSVAETEVKPRQKSSLGGRR